MVNTQVTWMGARIDVSVDFPGYIDGDGLSADGLRYVESLLHRVEAAKGHAADGLLDSYNRNWIGAAHPALSSEEFCSRLRLEAVALYDEPNFATMFFADSDMFGGHHVTVDFEGTEPDGATLTG
jgi:hypothetical protein